MNTFVTDRRGKMNNAFDPATAAHAQDVNWDKVDAALEASTEQALRIRIPSVLLSTARADTSPVRSARRAWVRAVQRYCSNLGVAPPEWMVPSPPG